MVFKEWYFLTQLARSIPTWRQKNETRHFAIAVVGWVNFFAFKLDNKSALNKS